MDGDTTFTSLLAYELTVDANGGVLTQGCGFSETCETSRVRVRYDDDSLKFSEAAIAEKVGTPITEEASKRFIGYATSPNATEPDIIDGETWLEYLETIYAVWGDAEPSEDTDEDDVPVPNTGVSIYGETGSANATNIITAFLVAIITMIGTLIVCKRYFKK